MTKKTALKQRANSAAQRIAAIGISRQEFAARADVDRGTLSRALKADPATAANDGRTWVKIERALDQLEEELGMTGQVTQHRASQNLGAATASGESVDVVVSTVEYAGATITLQGKAEAVAEAIRRVLSGDSAE